jgi:peptide deformylase
MILPIVPFGSDVLRKECINIDKSYENLDSLIDNMFETMYAASGVGLAAPQINKSLRLFIIDTEPFEDAENTDHVGIKKVFINPKILLKFGDIWSFNEGCLSIPDVREDVKRVSEVKLEYFDENFEKNTDSFSGLNARVILHEYDHIEGVLFIDKITPLRKRMIKGKLKNIKNGDFFPQYSMRASR